MVDIKIKKWYTDEEIKNFSIYGKNDKIEENNPIQISILELTEEMIILLKKKIQGIEKAISSQNSFN